MKQVLLLIFTWCVALAVHAQDVPYSKYLKFSKNEFKENRFKYDDETNTWTLRKVNGWNTALNVLAIIADAEEEVRPGRNDYGPNIWRSKLQRRLSAMPKARKSRALTN